MNDIAAHLDQLREAGLYRRTRLISGPQGPRITLDGKPVALLCSNNYLGFADHPRVREAAADAAMRWGVGAGASRLVSGTMTIHERLERALAEFEGTESCVLFGSGYLANVGVLQALGSAGQTIFSDALNHASIIDGCRLARADTFVYGHCDLDHLEWALRERGREGDVIVTDSVFSMDGDVAPLAGIVELARRHGARVVVDEAHATGALGPGGRGAIAEAGLEGRVDVLVGTLSKALGSYGGYVCAGREIVELLLNGSRALIFSTAPPPPSIAGALAALELLIEQPLRPAKLQATAAGLRAELAAAGIAAPEGRTQIVPLIVGDADAAVRLSEAALARGVFAQAIRPPTVPDGSSRLRLTVMASHTASELAAAVAMIGQAACEVGVTFTAAAAAAEPVARAA
jgi:8-amino-7-oxononanoate synthase